MAGLEIVVRPVVFPDIRPPPARALAPEDNPEQDIVTFSGSGGRLIDLPRNWSVSVSRQRAETENKRQFDVARIYQVDEQGEINRDNFIDIEIMKKVRLDSDQGPIKMIYGKLPTAPNIEILKVDQLREGDVSVGEVTEN